MIESMTGVTYSTIRYEEYEKYGNKNLFEDVIDKMMLENFPDDFKNKISTLSKKDKRMAILSLLDKDRNLFMKIKSLINEGLGKYEHIKDVILMLREYVKVGEVEKKKYGEVMTPLELVKDMLNTLPEEVWTNPNLKWLDPANGTGPYPLMVIYKLMGGLKDWEPDEEKRYKHIVENMIYVCELQPKNMFLYMCAVDPWDNHDLNIYTGSFLSEDFDTHMKKVWCIDKFDVVIGNPPYNEEFSKSGTAKDLFDKFVMKSFDLSKLISMITPSRWFSKTSLNLFRDSIISNLKMIRHFDNASILFPNTEITGGVSYFLIDTSVQYETCDFNSKEISLKEQIEIFGSILYDPSEYILTKNIVEKISKSRLSNFNNQGYFSIKTNDIQSNGNIICYYSDQKGKKMSLPTKNGRYYSFVEDFSDTKNKKIKWKVITSSAYGANPLGLGRLDIIEPNEICSESFVFFDFDSKEECVNFRDYLSTKFVKFLISLRKNKQHVTSKVFELVPEMSMSMNWSDSKLNEYFNLTKSEIVLIKNRIK